jgi:hypothetical protein
MLPTLQQLGIDTLSPEDRLALAEAQAEFDDARGRLGRIGVKTKEAPVGKASMDRL